MRGDRLDCVYQFRLWRLFQKYRSFIDIFSLSLLLNLSLDLWIRSFIDSFIPPFIHSFIHSFTHSVIRVLFNFVFFKSIIHCFIHSFNRSFIHSFAHFLVYSCIHPSNHAFFHLIIDSIICSRQSMHSSTFFFVVLCHSFALSVVGCFLHRFSTIWSLEIFNFSTPRHHVVQRIEFNYDKTRYFQLITLISKLSSFSDAYR